MICLILDILIYNYTMYNSYFFLIGIHDKNIYYYLGMGLILDFIIFNTMFLNTIVLLIIYFINKYFSRFNQNNIYIYLLNLLVCYLVYIILTNIFLKNGIVVILINIGQYLFLNFLFYFLCFKLKKNEYN